MRTETVADAGEFAVRGGLVDLFPSGAEQALRLDFFGDEIETVRTFDPADQRTTGSVKGFTLLPASEALLDEDSIKRFRSALPRDVRRDRDRRSAVPGDQRGRRLAGMEHWLPLFEERLETLFDHLPPTRRRPRCGRRRAAEARFEAIADYHANRVSAPGAEPAAIDRSRPLALPRCRRMGRAARRGARPRRDAFPRTGEHTVVEFDVDGPRDFAPERAAGERLRGGRRAPRQGPQGRPQGDPRQLLDRRRASG